MHILLVHQYFLEDDDPGGSRFNEMTRVWSEAGHRVTVLAGTVHYATGLKRRKHRKRLVVREAYRPGVTVFRCHVSRLYNRSFAGRLWAYGTFLFSSLACGVVYVRERPSVVLASSPPILAGLTGLILSKQKRAPFVFELRDLFPESAIDAGVATNPVSIRLAYALEAALYRAATLVVGISPAFQRVLTDRKGVPSSKVRTIPNGADFALADRVAAGFDAQAFRRARGWEGKFVVLYVGAHGRANNLMQLVDAATLLRDRPDILFVAVGDGMERERLVREAERRQLQSLEFLPSVPKLEIFRYILAADVGAAILMKAETFTTGYPNKLFDYMACGKPVLLAIDGVARELVEGASCGRFVCPDDPEDLARNVLFYDEHREEARRDGARGLEVAKRRFDRERLAQEYLDVLETVIVQPSIRGASRGLRARA